MIGPRLVVVESVSLERVITEKAIFAKDVHVNVTNQGNTYMIRVSRSEMIKAKSGSRAAALLLIGR